MVGRPGKPPPWTTHIPWPLGYLTPVQPCKCRTANHHNNLQNNFKWNWMDDHGEALLKIIHDVYPGNTGDGISEVNPPSTSSTASNATTTSSNSKSHARP